MELANKTIREIALEIPASTGVFEELKIDYCCGGHKNFKDACVDASVSPQLLEEKISSVLKNTNSESVNDFTEEISLTKLIDNIVEEHHTYTNNEVKRLTPLMAKVALKHGEKYPELLKVQTTFANLCNELIPHMQKEEFVLFPYIKNLEASETAQLSMPSPPFGTVKNPVRMMSMEHDAAGDFLKEIRKLTNDFKTPENACPSYKALYFGLEEFEKDLHQHIHLENNILFPLAIELEDKSN